MLKLEIVPTMDVPATVPTLQVSLLRKRMSMALLVPLP